MNHNPTYKELRRLTRMFHSANAKRYLVICALALSILFIIAVWDFWEKTNGIHVVTVGGVQSQMDSPTIHAFRTVIELARATNINLFATLLGLACSLMFARFVFSGEALDETSLESGVESIRLNQSPAELLEEMYTRIANSKSEVIISDNWLYRFEEGPNSCLRKSVKSALEHGVNVSFVFMHPNSPSTHRREIMVSHLGHEVGKNIMDSIGLVHDIYKSCCENGQWAKKGRLNVYCVDGFLAMQAYVISDVAYIGFYGGKGTSIQGPQILAHLNGEVGEMARIYATGLKDLCSGARPIADSSGRIVHYGTRIIFEETEGKTALGSSPSKTGIDGGDQAAKSVGLSKPPIVIPPPENIKEANSVSLKDLQDQILDSTAIDFYRILSRKDAVLALTKYLKDHPEMDKALGRSSATDLKRVIIELRESIDKT